MDLLPPTHHQRAEFQRMIAQALIRPCSFDAIIVLNYSRFMREDHLFEVYRRKLEKAGVQLISATQQLGEGIYGDLTRKIVTAIDAATSEINAIQVRTMMSANAVEGFWNGSVPPLGYRTFVAERRGKKDKKKLEIDPVEAELYLEIVDRYLGRKGHPDLGVAGLAKALNNEGLRHRGQKFSPGLVHTILTRETYCGRHHYNMTDSRTRKTRPREDWICVEVPRLMSEATFGEIQRRLSRRDPRMTPARSHSTPVLLSGIARCGSCDTDGATMMLMTGKGGRHRYYACSARRRLKEEACGGNNVPMQMVDDVVLTALEKRLFQPERLQALLGALLDRSDTVVAERARRLTGIGHQDRTRWDREGDPKRLGARREGLAGSR